VRRNDEQDAYDEHAERAAAGDPASPAWTPSSASSR
jgi:hypothetical protein